MICVAELEKLQIRAYRRPMKQTLAERIKLIRQSRGETQAEFADALGTTQGTVARWEKGSAPKHEALSLLATMAGVSLEHFLGQPMRSENADEIPIVGYVGAGAAVYPYDDLSHAEGMGTVERPEFVKGRAVAVTVSGDSLVPTAEDGWRLIYAGDQTILEEDVLNRLCIVKLVDGRMLVKRVVRGSEPQRYHLVSTNAAMIENVQIEWAARIKAIIPS